MLETSGCAAGTGPTMSALLPIEPRTVTLLLEFLVGTTPAYDLWDDQGDPARDLPAPQLIQCLVGFGQRARADLTADPSCCGQSEDIAQILPRTDGACLDAHFRGGHQDWREADVLGRQSDN